jgi:hypothetical protein
MGFFKNLFCRPSEASVIIDDANERLQLALIINLERQYWARFPPTDALHLANCVLDYATLIQEASAHSRQYYQSHQQLVRDEAAQLWTNTELAEAFSYLYATLNLKIYYQSTRQKYSELSPYLIARATELNFDLPEQIKHLNFVDCVNAISAFAQDYLEKWSPVKVPLRRVGPLR